MLLNLPANEFAKKTNLVTNPAAYLQAIETAFPTLTILSTRLNPQNASQFNNVLIVNEVLIFRFPRMPAATIALEREIKLLNAIKTHLPLPVPNPIYSHLDSEQIFMGYPMLPGVPLWREIIPMLDEPTFHRIAQQLAEFALALHSIPVETLGVQLSYPDDRSFWQEMYDAFRDELFSCMREDARQQVTHNFETFLNDKENFAYAPVLHHGDLGGSNILYDAERRSLSGIIDFDSIGLGDPAVDIAAVSSFGETFMHHFRQFYPNLEALEKRSAFYRSTFASQQALWAIRGGDQEAFEDGISAYI